MFVCQKCSFKSAKWLGRCPECGAWDSFVEMTATLDGPGRFYHLQNKEVIEATSLEEIMAKSRGEPETGIYPFASSELNRFWAGGLAAGSLTLLAGEPGLGKSTLALQILRSLWSAANETASAKVSDLKLLYITAEESVLELARRSQRLQIPKQILVAQSNNLEQIERILAQERPEVAVIDSIQTIFSTQIQATPGSVSQVSLLASSFLAMAKSQNISIILIGHVTKEGQIAGPKTLEHLVDSVLMLEATRSVSYRTLSFSKHRFGTTDGLLLLKMEASGLQIVTDPSLALLENLETGVGVCYGIAMDKDLPLVVEVQALVSKTAAGDGGYGRREALGLSVGKVNTILAIAEKYLGLHLRAHEVYVQLTGLPKNVTDDSLDVVILLAILSSLKNQEVSELLAVKIDSTVKGQKMVFAGRLTLSGKIRKATSEESRQSAAAKLGFKFNPNLKTGNLSEVLRI